MWGNTARLPLTWSGQGVANTGPSMGIKGDQGQGMQEQAQAWAMWSMQWLRGQGKGIATMGALWEQAGLQGMGNSCKHGLRG